MKKFLVTLLAVLMIIPMIVSCSSNKNETGNTQGTTSLTPAVTTPEPDVDPVIINTWVVEGYEKIVLDKDFPEDATTEIALQMAKNEKEGFHIGIVTSANVEGLKINITEGARDDIAIEMFNEHYVKTRKKYYPDPIVPSDGTVSTIANENSAVLVRFSTESDTEAGNHIFKFSLTDAEGTVVAEYKVDLTVWDFALPEYFTTESAIGINLDYISSLEKLPTRLAVKYYEKYYEMLLDYGFTAYDLPYDILNEKADAYMSDPRVTSFRVSYYEKDEKIKQYYEKLKSNPVWLEKAYFYPFDEPTTIEHLDELAERCKRLKELAPEIDIVIPFFTNIQYDNDTDEIEFLDDYVTIWCPKSACWKEGWLKDPLGRGYFGDRMDEQKAEGDKVWWYVCWEPGPPYCNLYVDEVGLDHIKLFWQQYQANSDGFLYWCSNYWRYTDNPWEDMATVKWLSNDVYGDGSLFYPGKPIDYEGPVASLRLECMRNGMEDIELLKLAEELLGREWVDAQVLKVSKNLTNHEKDNDDFNAVRKAIGDAVQEAMKNK